MCYIQYQPVRTRDPSRFGSVEGRAKMEGSPVLCAKLLLGKGGTEPQNAAFYIHNDTILTESVITQRTADGLALLPKGWWMYLWHCCALSLCVFYSG